MNTQAQLADSMPRPSAQEGYVAERHASISALIVVWAPCGCYYVAGKDGYYTTTCMKEDCDFSYAEVERALDALRAAEEAAEHGISVVRPDSSAVGAGTEAGAGPQGAVAPAAEGEVGGEVAPEVQAARQAEAMISEGGPVPAVPVDAELDSGFDLGGES